MNRFIKNLVLFLFFSAGTYLLLLILFGELVPPQITKNLSYGNVRAGHLQTRLGEADTTTHVDVLVLGSSHAYRGYDPRIFQESGYRIFNLGSSAQTFLQTELLMKRYIDSMRPKLVIFDVYPTLFSSDGVESSLELISKGFVNAELGKLIITQNNVKLYNAFAFAFYKQYLNPVDPVRESIQMREDTYIKGGYVQSSSEDFKNESLTTKPIAVEDLQWEAFVSIVELLKAREIEVVLVQSPILKEKYKSYSNIETFDSLLSNYGNYLNFNHILDLDQTFFLDPSHLNQKGVEVFNNSLLDIINSCK